MNKHDTKPFDTGTFPVAVTHPVIQRDSLLEGLAKTLKTRSVFISAPTGYGKTTLLSQFAYRFKPSHCLDFEQIDKREAKDFLTESLRRLSAGETVILDNVHLARKKSCARLEAVIKRSVSMGGTLLMAGQGSGGVNIEQLVVSGCLARFTGTWLSFSEEEVAEFMESLSRGPLLTAQGLDSAEIYGQTEGWPAAVACVCFFAESSPSVLTDYLDENFYNNLDIASRQALRDASILDSFSAPAFLHISGGYAWSAKQRHTLPVMPVPNCKEWQFHRLYKKHLQSKLQSECMEGAVGAHKRAAIWYQNACDHYKAASHAIETGDINFTVSVLNEGARHFIAVGRVTDALNWLNYLNDTESHLAHKVRLFRIAALILSLRFDEAYREHDEMVALVASEKAMPIPADWVDELHAHNQHHRCLLRYCNPSEKVDHFELEQVIADYENTPHVVSGETAVLNGMAYYNEGRFEEAESMFLYAIDRVIKTGSWLAAAYSYTALATVDCWRRSVDAAIERIKKFLEILEDAGVQTSPVYAFVEAHLANYYLYSGDTERALQHIRKSPGPYGFLDQNGKVRALLLLAKTCLVQEDLVSAKEIYIKINAIEGLQPWVRRIVQISMARLNLIAHNIEKARSILPRSGFKPLSDSNASETTSAELRAQILDLQIRLAEEAHEDLVSLGKLCVKRANSLGIYPLIIEALCTCALASSHALDGSEAHRTLKEALNIARRTNCAGVIIFFPLPGLRQLLNELAAASTQSDPETVSYIRALLENKPGGTDISSSKVHTAPEMVPSLLTQKERQVLGLLAVGYSNQKMADTLMVSLATTKWHVRNILSKLDATNRSEAVAKARLANIVG